MRKDCSVERTMPGNIRGDVGLYSAGSQGIPPAQALGNIYNGGPIAAQAQAALTVAHNDAKGRPVNRFEMTIGTAVLIPLLLFFVGALPAWSHSRNWGYYPSGGLGVMALILLVLVLTGRIH